MGCIPPIPDPATKALTCPDGFYFDTTTGLCCPVSTAPVNMQDPTIKKLVLGIPETTFDPHQFAKVAAEGWKDSGIIERFIVAVLEIPLKIARPLIELAASIVDDLLTVLGEAFLAAQGEHASGYYRLAAALMEDMLNIQVDEEGMVNAFKSGGRIAAMQELGAKVVETLTGEFLGVSQKASDGTFVQPKGTGVAGLPDVALSEVQGVGGLKRFVGFMTAFAIREGNTDFLASIIPHDLGHIYKEFAEDFAKNLGIGRLGRIAWKPLITTTVATPAQWALNTQYRPTLFDVGQAYRAWAAGVFTSQELLQELARHGWSEHRQQGLEWQHLKGPDRVTLRVLRATGQITPEDYAVWEGRDGRTAEVTALLDKHDDILPVRNAVLRTADGLASEYLRGRITQEQYHGGILTIARTALGFPMLTDGEVSAFQSIEGKGVGAPRVHMRLALLFREYEDGLITLGEFEQHVTQLGYSPDDVTVLVQELLLQAKRATDKAALAAHRAQRGRFAHLSVAQMKTAFADGLMTLDEVKAELATRLYAPDAIATIANEFLIAAKLRPVTPPQA
jgi:hypothetical protein